eukprot:gene5069-34863_t
MLCSQVTIRSNTSEEVCDDMRSTPPDFEQCIAPLVLWSRWPYNVAETYGALYMRLAHAVESGTMSANLAPVVATPHGLKIPHFTKIFLESVFNRLPISFADLSARMGCHGPPPSSSLSSGSSESLVAPPPSGRCFKQAHLCKLKTRDDAYGVVKAGRSLLKHFKGQIEAKGAQVRGKGPWSGADEHVMRVVFATRPGLSSRRLINEDDLVTQCNKWTRQSLPWALEGLPEPPRQYSSARCVAHVFGKSMVEDMALMEHASVFVALHGAACMNSYYMPDGAALIEVRPLGMPSSWASAYFHKQLGVERLVHWYGINILNRTNSVESTYEAEDAPVLNPTIKSRERSVLLPWPVLHKQLDLVSDVGGVADRYYQLALKSGRYYVADDSSLVPSRTKSSEGRYSLAYDSALVSFKTKSSEGWGLHKMGATW